MMKKLLAGAAMLLVLAACQKDPAPELSLSAPSLTFEAAGGTQTFQISSNTEWQISKVAQADWVTVSPASGKGDATITVEVKSYDEAAGRSAQLLIEAEGLVQNLAIVQVRPAVPSDPSVLEYKVQALAQDLTVDVPAGYAYKVTIPTEASFVTVKEKGKTSVTLHFEVNGTAEYRNADILIQTSDDKTLETIKVSQSWRNVEPGELLIEELFFASNLLEDGKSTADGEQYLRLTNNADHTVYADGVLVMVENFFGCQQSVTGSYWAHPDLDDAICVEVAYAIPGSGTDVPIEPGKSLILAVNAQDFSADNANGFDLSRADFEFYDENEKYPDIDNPDVPNLENLFKRSESVFLMHKRGYECYALAVLPPTVSLADFDADYRYDCKIEFWMNGSVLTTADLLSERRCPTAHRVPNEWVLDGVNGGVEENFRAPQFNASVDAGYTGCGTQDNDPERFGKSALRNRDAAGKLADTNNSTNDFTRNATPTLKK